MEIKSARFRCAALGQAQRPREWLPHVAVAGRSNVGKSSLINWLFRQSVARVAKAPGKTRTLNFYLVNDSFFLVDMPGYGYAKVGKSMRQQWSQVLGKYLAEEERLAGVIALADIRHGPTKLDLELYDYLLACKKEFLIVLTKADKVRRGNSAKMQSQVTRQLGLSTPPVTVSVRTGQGRSQLLTNVQHLVDTWRQAQRGD